jgi:hypothetical protein
MSTQIAENNNESRSRTWLGILFFFWPFVSFVVAARSFNVKSHRIFVVLFFAFYGYTMALTNTGSDGYRHSQDFIAAGTKTPEDYVKDISSIITGTSKGDVDLYITTVDFIMSRFTSSPQLVFLFHGFLFAFLAVRVYSWLYDETGAPVRGNALVYFVLILTLNSIHKLPLVRFPIAQWMFVFGMYQYLKTEKWKHLAWCFGAVLVHFSFIFGLVTAMVFVVFKRNNLLYAGLVVLSYIFPDLLHNYLIALDPTLVGEGIGGRIEGYSDQEYIDTRTEGSENTNWYKRIRNDVLKYAVYGSFLGIDRNILGKMDRFQKNLFSYLILLLAFVNFGSTFDSLGYRFNFVWLLFASMFLFRYYQINYPGSRKLNMIPRLVIPAVMFTFIMELRQAMESMSLFWIIGNPITATLIPIEQSIISVVN